MHQKPHFLCSRYDKVTPIEPIYDAVPEQHTYEQPQTRLDASTRSGDVNVIMNTSDAIDMSRAAMKAPF